MRVFVHCTGSILIHEDEHGCTVLAAPQWALTMSSRTGGLAQLRARFQSVGPAAVLQGTEWLDLDYALLVTCHVTRTVHAAVGARGSRRWYIKHEHGSLYFYDELVSALSAVPTAEDVSRDRLVDFFANAISVGPYDIASDDAAVVRPYEMIRKGHYRVWREGGGEVLRHTNLSLSLMNMRIRFNLTKIFKRFKRLSICTSNDCALTPLWVSKFQGALTPA